MLTVSTHAHLSVGGRRTTASTTASSGRFQPTPTCLSVGDAPRAPGGAGPRGFNPRPPVCRWATDPPRARPWRGSCFNPRPPVSRWATSARYSWGSGHRVSTHAHLSVGGRRRRGARSPHPPQVSTHAHLSVGGRPAPPGGPPAVGAVSTHAHLSVGGRPLGARAKRALTKFQPTPTCLSVGDDSSRVRTAVDALVFQPTPTCLSVGDHGAVAEVADQRGFQPTPTCLSVGDPERVRHRSAVRVSTHAHLSVGGRQG